MCFVTSVKIVYLWVPVVRLGREDQFLLGRPVVRVNHHFLVYRLVLNDHSTVYIKQRPDRWRRVKL